MDKRFLFTAKDEYGRVVSVIKLVDDITEEKKHDLALMDKVNAIVEIMKAAEEGDLTKEINVSGDEPVDLIGLSIKKFLTFLRENISHIANSSDALLSSSEELTSIGQQMAGNAEETATQASAVSNSAEDVSKNIQTVAASAEQLNISIKEIAKTLLTRRLSHHRL